MGLLDGKVAFVTGAARGQGRSHALALAGEGADVAIVDICADICTVPYPLGTLAELKETAAAVEALGRRCLWRRADIRDSDALAAAIDDVASTWGHIDICVANAGICAFGEFWKITDEMWDDMIAVDLTGTFKTLRAVVPHMIREGGGRIVATSSMAGRMGNANLAHYSAAKWGVIGLVKTLALEVARYGITVNAVCPGAVDTPMVHNDALYGLFAPDLEAPTKADVAPRYAALNPMRVPWVDPEDVSAAVVHLVSDAARYTSGQTLDISAGTTARSV